VYEIHGNAAETIDNVNINVNRAARRLAADRFACWRCALADCARS